jgi:hypothetical protein
MKNRTLVGAAASSFAHLIGRAPATAAKKAAEDKDKDRMEDDEDARRAESDDDDEKDKDDEARKASRAESDDDEDDKDKSEKEDDDEDDDKRDDAKKAERKRCAAIVAHGIKLGQVEQAGILAFDTDLPIQAALSVLNASAAAAPRKGGLASRMSSVSQPNVGASDAAGKAVDGADAIAAQMVAVYDRATGSK